MPHEIVMPFICMSGRPWTSDIVGQTVHPEAVSIGDTEDGCERFKCPICGLVFEVELPE